MRTHKCCHGRGPECLDDPAGCGAPFPPPGVRRVLKRVRPGEEEFRDVATGQRFKARRLKDGTRLVPLFKGRVKWGSAEGYDAVRLLLSCLGSEGRYTLWSEATGAEMMRAEWMGSGYGCISKVPVRCSECDEVVTSTIIGSILQGHSVGCICNSTLSNHWKHRRAEVVAAGVERGFLVLTPAVEWTSQCTGCKWKPLLQCIECREVVVSTDINHLFDEKLGCKCNSNIVNKWSDRRSEVVLIGNEKGFRVVTTEEEWVRSCIGSGWKPTFQCNRCGDLVTSTTVGSIQQGRSIGCHCNSSLANIWKERRAEIVEIGLLKDFSVVTSEEEWTDQCTGAFWKPALLCRVCGDVVTSTDLHSLDKHQNIGCRCHSNHANHWRHRRSEIVKIGVENNFQVQTKEEEWVAQCTGSSWKPVLACQTCGDCVTSTNLASIQQGGSIGCSCNSAHANHWRNRRNEVVEYGVRNSFKVLTSQEEWVEKCTGKAWKPNLECNLCRDVVTSTQINALQQGHGIGCSCVNKTEQLLFRWLKAGPLRDAVHNELTCKRASTGGTMRFDFSSASAMAIVELDGEHWAGDNHFSEEGDCAMRDLEKERWALAHGYQVFRVLQKDVWSDARGWDNWLATQIAAWRDKRARGAPSSVAVHPDDPLYLGGVYARLRG